MIGGNYLRINIFGVGRSGTKAIQLYLSYLLAKKEKEVWVNYEPYYWKDRKALNLNYEGIYYHINSPLFIESKSELSVGHRRYLKKLVSHDKSIITKFIRANGRLKAINKIMEPDFTIVVIRDLYQSLESLSKLNWDYVGRNLLYNEWERLVTDVKKINNLDMEYYLKYISSDSDKNAFYWYVMNLVALNYKGDNIFYVDYENLSLLKQFVLKTKLVRHNSDLHINKFEGMNIHNNNLFLDIDKENVIYDKFSFAGSLVCLRNCINLSEKTIKKNNYYNKNKYFNDLYEHFRQNIQNILQSKIKNNVKIFMKTKWNFIKKEKYKENIKENIYSIKKITSLQSWKNKYKYFISFDLVNFLLNNSKAKVIIYGTDDNSKIINEFILKANKMFSKNINVIGIVDNLSLIDLNKIDKVIISSFYENEFFLDLFNFGLKPERLIFSNKKYAKKTWEILNPKVTNDFSYLFQYKISEPFISKELSEYFVKVKKSKVIIFGVGEGGKKIYKLINNVNKYMNKFIEIIIFIDNDSSKWGKKYFNKEIRHPHIIKTIKFDKIIIASSWKNEIKQQLLKSGVREEKIILAF